MQTSLNNRLFWIFVALWIAASAIYQNVPGSFFWFFHTKDPISFHDSLKPGIDIAGGDSLIYEIKSTGGIPASDLSERVATALKKRVDPQGVRNIVWRPLGPTRLEIQLPAGRNNEAAEKAQSGYITAKNQLEKTNVRVVSVMGDIESLAGTERDARIAEYSGDYKERGDIIQQMKMLFDKIKTAREKGDSKGAVEARLVYEPLQESLIATNLSVSQLESILELPRKDRDDKVAELKKTFGSYKARTDAIDAFVAAHDQFIPLRDNLDDIAKLKRDLRGSGVLSFNILVNRFYETETWDMMATRLRLEGPRPKPGDVCKWFLIDNPKEFKSLTATYNGKFYCLAYIDPERSLMNGEGLPKWGLAKAGAEVREAKNVVTFEFDVPGSKLCADLTGRWRPDGTRNYQMGIVLDDKMYSAPNINTQIFGNGEISGDFSQSEVEYLATTLNAGALPAQLTDEPISERTIGPQLGADNLKAGLVSCAAGLVIVGVFMIGYYYFSGMIAMIAVLMNLVLIVGAMAVINATFTLPGIAGIVLSVAMAVDANVLIFERLREEQARGLSLKMALRNSYDRAFSAIFDSQVTTAISSMFLFWFGSEEVRGFGLTLLIGIVTSLFTALFVTKTIFGILVDKFHLDDLSSLPRTYPKWNKMLNPNINWIGLCWVFILFSVVFISIGMTLFIQKFHSGEALDIEFSGGTSVQVELVEPMNREAVQEILDKESLANKEGLANPRAVSIGKERLEYSISTPTIDTKQVQKAVVQALVDKLKIAKSSQFDGVDQELDSALSRTVFPIESNTTRVEGIPQYLINSHVGGVAIVLDHVSPVLSMAEMQSRIEQRLLQQESTMRPEHVEVEQFDNGNRAVILMSDSRYAYNQSDGNALQQWRTNLGSSAWQIVREAINKPPTLKGVTSFNAQVASEAKYNTVLALTMSVLGIMAFIWVRFGNLKFGTATVIACLHDALFVVAAIGLTYYVGQIKFFEEVFLIKPFRVDLTLVAAVLTVVGYSMNDTVVVFDRVRENRGKFGALSKQVINDSINQTFSRTLLTGGVSIGILLVMYIIGGEGIHAFTFAMLLGILVGTYSSIAVAAPMLLLGNKVPIATSLAKAKPAVS